ncbi:MAG: hypothetical protein BAJATHORv1_10631 [Candidatus Thorarchaeota archaeon]|nr:MAG: hypothetical protein BAJATHORv1_10631 [Candidatus Thorarchaeota archaeon]
MVRWKIQLGVLATVLLLVQLSTTSNLTIFSPQLEPDMNQEPDFPFLEEDTTFSIASSIREGTLNPIDLEQRATYVSDYTHARTDNGLNTSKNLPIDASRNWVGSQAELDVWNLKRQYAMNGTFDEGVGGTTTLPGSLDGYPYGWDVDYYESSGGDQSMSVSYDNESNWVRTSISGEEGSPNVDYTYYAGSYVMWNQTFSNTPYTTNFTISFNYLYEAGVIDLPGGHEISSLDNVWIVIYANNSFWTWDGMSLVHDITEQGVWLSSGNLDFDFDNAPSVLRLELVFTLKPNSPLILEQTMIMMVILMGPREPDPLVCYLMISQLKVNSFPVLKKLTFSFMLDPLPFL